MILFHVNYTLVEINCKYYMRNEQRAQCYKL